jgi:spore maturation protein CgeB
VKVLISGAFESSAWQNPLFPAIADAVASLGHEVHRFDAAFEERPTPWQKALERVLTVPVRLVGGHKRMVKPFLPWTATYQQEQGLLAAVQAHRPDTLLVMSYVRYRPQVLARCRAMGVRRLVGWFLEGPTHEYRAEADAAFYDRYFCIHPRINAEMAPHITWLPTMCLDRAQYHPLDGAVRGNKIVFVGARTPRRVQYLRALKSLPLTIWGPGGWADEPDLAPALAGEFIWGEQLNRLYNEAAMVLNVSSWDPALGGLTQRVIDVPATGALLLTDACADLAAFFRVGEEIDTFTTPQDLADKCRFYLGDTPRREYVALAGHRRALQSPSSVDIARQLLA